MNGDDTPVQAESLIGLIDQLVEPAGPDPVAMTPQTAGWTVLAVLVLLLMVAAAWRFWRHWRSNAYRRAALVELEAAGDDPAVIAAILRRTALAAWPRERVASLIGTDWLRFLDQTGGEGFVSPAGAALTQAPYASAKPSPELAGLAKAWIRRHRLDIAP